MIVLDTCALIWWTLAPEKLSSRASASIQAELRDSSLQSKIVVSSVSVWEISVKCKKNKLTLGVSPKEYVDKLHMIDKLRIAPVDESLWLDSVELVWEHNDHVDRVIVSLAAREAASLITCDAEIRKFYTGTVW